MSWKPNYLEGTPGYVELLGSCAESSGLRALVSSCTCWSGLLRDAFELSVFLDNPSFILLIVTPLTHWFPELDFGRIITVIYLGFPVCNK